MNLTLLQFRGQTQTKLKRLLYMLISHYSYLSKYLCMNKIKLHVKNRGNIWSYNVSFCNFLTPIHSLM